MDKNSQTAVTELLDDILDILAAKGGGVADLARDLGRSYNQVYDWIKMRKVTPRAHVVLQLQAWRDKHRANVRSVSAAA